MDAKITIDTREFNSAMRKYRTMSSRDTKTALNDAVRIFLRIVVSVIPPATGKINSKSKQAGETAVKNDIKNILSYAKPWVLKAYEKFHHGKKHSGKYSKNLVYAQILSRSELAGWHKSNRTSRGRTRPLQREQMSLTDEPSYKWFVKQEKKQVGKLASGWNRAAEKFNYNPPAWVRRHGNARGDVQISVREGNLKITVRNNVKYGTNVKNLERQLQFAVKTATKNLLATAAVLQRKTARAAGF